jgi:ribosomal-protein-alanine N-acetyltransferase
LSFATPQTGPLILPARPADLDAICGIADAAFTLPWPREELALELTRPYSSLRVVRPSTSERVVGFLNHWRLGDELQIMNVAVAPTHQRRGFASALLRDTELHARGLMLGAIFLEVRRSNTAAIRLYETHAYAIIGVRHRYYADNAEDALVMKVDLRG